MFIGSCFAENIGSRLQELCFDTVINPFGVLYNPASVAQSLRILLSKKEFLNTDLNYNNELYFSYKHHSSFSSPSASECLSKINQSLIQSSEYLYHANFLFLTLGTAWVYRLKETGEIVSNCHKTPSEKFDRFLLGVDEIYDDYVLLFKELWNVNPNLKIVITVSPVRHWKDGAEGNQQSKATLILASNRLKSIHNVFYFPAYEIVMDDLRDYRFYAEDMLHPNSLAINYIWEKFGDGFLDNKTKEIAGKISKLNDAMQHRPFNSETETYKQFKKMNLTKIQQLNQHFPYLNLSKLERFFT